MRVPRPVHLTALALLAVTSLACGPGEVEEATAKLLNVGPKAVARLP
jgi:hypothetical protein